MGGFNPIPLPGPKLVEAVRLFEEHVEKMYPSTDEKEKLRECVAYLRAELAKLERRADKL